MKKIGICTLHMAKNFGAILQAFALQTTLKKLGYESEFITIGEKERNEPASKSMSVRQYEKYRESISWLNESDHIYDKDKDNYDLIIIGSDELWNLDNNFTHYREYFGFDMGSSKVITYAPSANTTKMETFNYYFEEIYKEKTDFKCLDRISVRDIHTKNVIETLCNREVSLVLDPTFLIKDFSEHIKEVKEKDYILIYGYRFSESEKAKIQKLSKDKNIPVYAIGFNIEWADKVIEADIFEFLSYMKNATYVISNSFHGVVFSILLEKQFIALTNGMQKIVDVLNKFSIIDRDCTNVEDITAMIDENIDYKKVNEIKNIHVKNSFEYLTNAIENK